MTFQLGICVIVAVLLMGSVSCALRGMDRRDEGGEGYAVWSVGMMLGAIVRLRLKHQHPVHNYPI